MLMSMSKIIYLFPFFILIFSIFTILFSIIIYRSHIFSFITTIFALTSILYILPYMNTNISMNISTLIYINFYSLIYIALIILCSLFIATMSYFYLNKYFIYKEEFYILFLSSIFGSFLTVLSNNMISLFIGIELMSLPVIGLMIYSILYDKIIQVMLRYMILSIISSIFMIFGISIIYTICGNFNFNSIKIYFLINDFSNNQILLLGITFLLISLFFKLSLFPLHFWIPGIYKNTYSILLTYITTVFKIATFSILIKLFMYFPYFESNILYHMIELVSICSIVFGSIMILFQKNIKMFLGYSSIIHMGYISTILLIKHQYHITNEISIIYFINYIISNIGIFSLLIFSELYDNIKNNKIYYFSYYTGLFYISPILTIVITIIILSFLGIPFTIGFITKFLIIFLSLYHNNILIIIAILINSGLGIYYYLKIVRKFYLYQNIQNNISLIQQNKKFNTFILFIGFIIIFFGVFPNILIKIIDIHLL